MAAYCRVYDSRHLQADRSFHRLIDPPCPPLQPPCHVYPLICSDHTPRQAVIVRPQSIQCRTTDCRTGTWLTCSVATGSLGWGPCEREVSILHSSRPLPVHTPLVYPVRLDIAGFCGIYYGPFVFPTSMTLSSMLAPLRSSWNGW